MSIPTPMATRRILLIDDDVDLALMLREYLEPTHIELTLAHNSAQGLPLAMQECFDLVLLDLMLPDGNGLDLLRHLRRHSRRPVIMFTAHGGETDRVLGLELGADDYLTKPFGPRELKARIGAVLRRFEEKPEPA
ncbi:response regulator, partial [Achromobacter xylosoxidans]